MYLFKKTKLFDYHPETNGWHEEALLGLQSSQTIMDRHIAEIASLLGPGCLLIEYGSGSSQKTRTLLDHMPQLAGYVPIDISRERLLQSVADIAAAYPRLEVLPVCADYETPFQIPAPVQPESRYPGSTIGNFHPPETVAFLKQIRAVCGDRCELLIGVDLWIPV